jgi:hypothetical protein
MRCTRALILCAHRVGVMLALGMVLLCACAGRNGASGAGEPSVTTRTSIPADHVIASGDGWQLDVAYRDGICFTLVGPTVGSMPCFVVEPPGSLGSASVSSLGTKGALFYGTVSTRVAKIELHLDDGSVLEANILPPPEGIETEDNLFVLDLDAPEGSAIATLLDKQGKGLTTAEFAWAEGRRIGFTFQ